MCGIAGYLLPDARKHERGVLRTMCDRLVHRGPDDAGYLYEGPVALGHRRLSIIDVSGGHQPLGNEDGSVQVVFNGEIYNFHELRQTLVQQGHTFTTHSDTEVLVHLYEDVGDRLPEYLNGMFAFAIWDQRRQELFLARDRFGEKPLYYTASVDGFAFCFASELKALTALPGFAPKVSAQSVADFLALSYVPDPATIYEGVAKLGAGQSITVGRSGQTLRRYWQLQFAADETRSYPDAVEEVRVLAADSVKRRLLSDVPLGAFLSGGVDSSAVVGFMAAHATRQIQTFSIGFTNEEYDERVFARLLANRYQTDHHERVVSPDIFATLEKLFWHFDEPFGDPSAVPMLALSELTRQQVTVALSGDGADELFGGYRRYYWGVAEERLRSKFPSWFRRSVVKVGSEYYPKFDYLPQVFRAKTLLTNLAAEIGDAYFTTMSTFRDQGLGAILSPELVKRLGHYSARESFRGRFKAVSHLSPLAQMQAVDLDTFLSGDILVKTDRTTMAYSLESRPPWLDHRLAELAASLPASFHMQGVARKRLFKASVSSVVPQAVLNRRKMGFSVALSEWFKTALRPLFAELVLCPEMEGYVSPREASRLMEEHQSGVYNHDRKLWNLLMLGGWVKTHATQPTAMSAAGLTVS